MTTPSDFRVNQPDRERADALAFEAVDRAKVGDLTSAIPLIEEAIRLDSTAALDRFYILKVKFCASLGRDSPTKAMEMYDYAIRLRKQGRYRDAVLAYKEAAALDPDFIWPLNNLAWMLATIKEASVRNGQEAVRYAKEACEKSNWSCWAFLGTLAAAYAEAGDFQRAVGWQKAALSLVPEDHRLDAELNLRHFEKSQSYIDEGMPVAAGGSDEDDDGVDASKLLTPEKMSTKSLQEIFRTSFLRTELDADGDLWISDKLNVLVKIPNSGEQIHLVVIAKPSQNASMEACLRFVNRINTSIAVVRAAYHDNGVIIFDYTVPVSDGITKTAVVYAVQFFMGAVRAGIAECDIDGLISSGEQTNGSP